MVTSPSNIDTIITIVDKLEQHPECQLTEAKRLPPHLSFINFGCPQIEEVPIAAAVFTNLSSAAPRPGRGRSNTGRDRSNSQSRRGNTSDQNPRSTDRNMENRSRDKNKNHRSTDRSKDQKSREKSKDQQRSNSRNSSTGSAYSRSSSKSTDSMPSQYRQIQGHSSFSRTVLFQLNILISIPNSTCTHRK